MFSPASDFDPPARTPAGLRRGGPLLLREIMPAALDRVLGGQRPRGDSPGDDGPPHAGRPPLPRAA